MYNLQENSGLRHKQDQQVSEANPQTTKSQQDQRFQS